MNLFAKQKERHKHESTNAWTARGGGWLGHTGRLGFTYIHRLLCMKRVTNENLLYSMGGGGENLFVAYTLS